MYRVAFRICVGMLACGLVAPALAGEGRTPIYSGTTIINPGRYVVTRNIDVSGTGAAVIVVAARDVDIALNGFVLTNDAAAPVILANNVDNLTVRDGTLSGGSRGIEKTAGRKVTIEDVKSIGAAREGIYLVSVTDFAMRRNNIIDAGEEAIWVDGTATPFVHGTIEDNRIENCGGGIWVRRGSSVGVINNRLEGLTVVPSPAPPSQGAIVYDNSEGGLIARNTIEEVIETAAAVEANGIYLGDSVGTKIYNNVVRRCEDHGIFLAGFSDDNLVIENVVTDSGWDGVRVEGRANFIDRNLLNLNCGLGGGACWGLHFSVAFGGWGNTYGRNTARRNTGVAAACPAPATANPPTTDFCDEQPLGPLGYGNASFGDNYMPNLF